MSKYSVFLPLYFQILRDIASYCSLFSESRPPLWNLINRGFLFKAFQEDNLSGLISHEFVNKVNYVHEARRNITSVFFPYPSHMVGRLLAFYPSMTMYDCILEEITEGFFDSDDVPPPEFWLTFENETLISFIPDRFSDVATIGTENSISGCLEWLDLAPQTIYFTDT